MGRHSVIPPAVDFLLFNFFQQGGAFQAEHAGCFFLVAGSELQSFDDEVRFKFVDQFVEINRPVLKID